MEKKETRAWGITGFIIAIVGIFLTWLPIFGWIVWVLGVVFCALACYLQKHRGLAYAGLGISVVSLLFTIALMKACDNTIDSVDSILEKAKEAGDESLEESLSTYEAGTDKSQSSSELNEYEESLLVVSEKAERD